VAKQNVSPHVLELLRWLAEGERNYGETMSAWRSHCPRLTAWEDALAAGLIRIEHGDNKNNARVVLTASGKANL